MAPIATRRKRIHCAESVEQEETLNKSMRAPAFRRGPVSSQLRASLAWSQKTLQYARGSDGYSAAVQAAPWFKRFQ
jgi:hypothetical protein